MVERREQDWNGFAGVYGDTFSVFHVVQWVLRIIIDLYDIVIRLSLSHAVARCLAVCVMISKGRMEGTAS